MSSTITTPARRTRLGLAAAIAGLGLGVLPAPALADGATVASMSKAEEQKLYRAERAILGPQHAMEHRRQRTALRDPVKRRRMRLDRRRAFARFRKLRARKADASVGAWTTGPFDIDVMGIHTVVLPTGKVMFFSYPTNPSKGSKKRSHEGLAWLWDPKTGDGKRVDPPVNTEPDDSPNHGKATNIWCAGQSLLPNGDVLVTGGNYDFQNASRTFYRGLKTVLTFDPWTETWTKHPPMRQGRWYPTQTLQADGRTLIMSGLADDGVDTGTDTPLNKDVEIFTPSAVAGQPGRVDLASPSGVEHPLTGLYPHMWAMPSGRTLVAGPYVNDSFYMELSGNTYKVSDAGTLTRQRYWASGVLMPAGPDGSDRVMLTGGSQRGQNEGDVATTETFSESDGVWRAGPTMQQERAHHNTVLLPDGSMVSIGGGFGQQGSNQDQWAASENHKRVDVWDPADGTWRLGPSQVEKRSYHSTAVLLPDGRVLSAGDDWEGGEDRDTAEIYSPPYLFKPGSRPTVAAAPRRIAYGRSFAINAEDPDGSIAKAVLVAPGAVTHANDMNQRLVELRLAHAGDRRLSLTAPANGNIAPPGWYMLFVLDGAGKPSEATWVQLGDASEADPPMPEPRPTGTPRTAPNATSTGSTTRSALALGTFEGRSISPWRRRAGTVARVRTGHRGRSSLGLSARGRRAGVAERRVTRLRRGAYRLELWMRGSELRVQVTGGRRRTFRPSSSRRWSRVVVPVRVSRTWAPVRITLTGRSRSTVRVDDVTLEKR